jgi:hypothetical protein
MACVRFHGRDGETRWAGGAARRDYLYSWEELVGWLPALRALAHRVRDLFIVFNNPWRGRALENARMLRRLIGCGEQARSARLARSGSRVLLDAPSSARTFSLPARKSSSSSPDVFHTEGPVQPSNESSRPLAVLPDPPSSPDVFHAVPKAVKLGLSAEEPTSPGASPDVFQTDANEPGSEPDGIDHLGP